VPMLSRMAAFQGIDADPDVYGYSVAVEWIKPGSNPNGPTMEILAVFADKASTKAFLNKTLAPADYVQGVKLNFFDGDKAVGRQLHLDLQGARLRAGEGQGLLLARR